MTEREGGSVRFKKQLNKVLNTLTANHADYELPCAWHFLLAPYQKGTNSPTAKKVQKES